MLARHTDTLASTADTGSCGACQPCATGPAARGRRRTTARAASRCALRTALTSCVIIACRVVWPVRCPAALGMYRRQERSKARCRSAPRVTRTALSGPADPAAFAEDVVAM